MPDSVTEWENWLAKERDFYYTLGQNATTGCKEKDIMNSDSIYIEIPVEMEADITVQVLTKQLEAVEYSMQKILEEADGGEHKGQDMVDLTRDRDAIVRIINFNSMYADQISKEWQQK